MVGDVGDSHTMSSNKLDGRRFVPQCDNYKQLTLKQVMSYRADGLLRKNKANVLRIGGTSGIVVDLTCNEELMSKRAGGGVCSGPQVLNVPSSSANTETVDLPVTKRVRRRQRVPSVSSPISTPVSPLCPNTVPQQQVGAGSPGTGQRTGSSVDPSQLRGQDEEEVYNFSEDSGDARESHLAGGQTVEKDTPTSPKRDDAGKDTVSLLEVIYCFLLPITLSELKQWMPHMRLVVTGHSLMHKSKEVARQAFRIQKSKTLSDALLNIMRLLITPAAQKSQPTTTLQEFISMNPPDFCSSLVMNSAQALTLNMYFSVLKEAYSYESLKQSQDRSSLVSASMSKKTDTTSTACTSDHTTETTASASCQGTSNYSRWQASAMSTVYQPFQLKTPATLRNITWAEGSMNCTCKFPKNSGEYLVKMEIFRTADVQGIPAREWWKVALHRSQVFGNSGEKHIELAQERDRELRQLWVDPEHNYQPRFPEVETYGGAR